MYIGHKSKDGRVQPLHVHLQNVAALAKSFAEPFGAGIHAFRTGILHDAGKYSEAGQRRMNDPEHTAKVDHSSFGAKIARNQLCDAYAACAIAGHHGGIPNLGNRASVDGDGTLSGRCMKDLSGQLDASPFWRENILDEEDNRNVFPLWLQKDRNTFLDQFYTRMLFSCLVDSDYLDTESFMNPEESSHGETERVEVLLEHLISFIQARFNNPCNSLNLKRSEILQDCMAKAKQAQGVYTLTVPTGGGKTVSSLAFALAHAVQHKLKRVIYVIPYTSIIEQNARVFKGILGEEHVLEHHSGIVTDAIDDQENEQLRKKMQATENWDAPVIVTTAVQFFESLFSNMPSKCRKLHNIVNSVIIFDEAQMQPIQYLKPCVWAIAELAQHYHVTALLCTATQPSLNRFFSKYAPNMEIHEICSNVPAVQSFFRRVQFQDNGIMDTDSVAEELSKQEQVLCIVNSRKKAQALYQMLPPNGRFHLSTWMTPDHRSEQLKVIRERLTAGQTCRVVSTSLIEAGVDVDFPQVWREKAGLDSILQAAGRCNREMKRPPEESLVKIFSSPASVPKGIMPNITAAEIAIEDAEYLDDSSVIRTYFEQLYRMGGEKALDTHDILTKCRNCEFHDIAENFHLIESDDKLVYIPSEKNKEDIDELKAGHYSRVLMRRIGRSAVSVHPWEWEKLKENGKLYCLDEYSAILLDQDCYDDHCGLKMDIESGLGFFE